MVVVSCKVFEVYVRTHKLVFGFLPTVDKIFQSYMLKNNHIIRYSCTYGYFNLTFPVLIKVLRARIEYIEAVLSLSVSISSNLAELLLSDLIEKVGDTKVGDVTKIAMTKLAEKTSLELVGGFIMRTLFQIKNPRSQTEGLAWLNQSIQEFGFWYVFLYAWLLIFTK